MEVLNWQDGVARVVNNRELYAKLLGRFVDSMGDYPAKIAEMITAGNLEEARSLAHTVKGTAANIGAEALSEAALGLELSIKNSEDTQVALVNYTAVNMETLQVMRDFKA